ncbi:hypothetical protein [Actinoplanes derwentensis]|nr:hypothetical protein [Actinoplanes derwentensis]GID81993.1 hypothetical protein Ade03nite_09170 [Actinoplanes derwentensis]
MPELQIQALVKNFDERVRRRTASVGLVSKAAGEDILRALLVAHLQQRFVSVTRLNKCRPRVEVNGNRAVLDDAIVVADKSGIQELLSVEYKFWTASSYQGKAVPKNGPIEDYAWASWHQGLDEWKFDIERHTFLAWKAAAKVLGNLDRGSLPADFSKHEVRPVLAVWTPLLAQPAPAGSGRCWTEARLAQNWHTGEGYGQPLTVFSGSLFSRSPAAQGIHIQMDDTKIGSTINAAVNILHEVIR